MDNVVVPTERTWDVMHGEPSLDDPVVRLPDTGVFALHMAAMAVGTARGAFDEITELATTKVPLFGGAPLAASTTFHRDLAVADTELRAGRALLYESAEDTWARAVEGSETTLEQRARLRAAAAWAAAKATDVATTAYRAGGGSTVYADHPLQRRLRDAHAVTQHFLLRPDTLTTAGAVLAGQEIDVPVF